MTRAVPIIPLYACVEPGNCPGLRVAKPPWACSFVFITSSGHVTIPDANPAPAPQIGAMYACGICVECICKREMKDVSGGGEGIVLKLRRIGGVSVAEAYCDCRAVACGVGLRLYDILCYQRIQLINDIAALSSGLL